MSRSFARLSVAVVSLWAVTLFLPPVSHAYSDVAARQESPPSIAVTAAGKEVCVGGGGYHVCAWVSDPTPSQYTTVTVSAYCWGSVCELVPGPWTMTATWHFESGAQTCTETVPARGLVASCSLNIGAATLGYQVDVNVNNMVTTWFTPAVDCSTVTPVAPSECRALEALYNSTNGADWTNKSGWLTVDTPCSWYGVVCDTGHVSRLNLPSNRLSGGIPPDLGNLVNLRQLGLSSNRLSESIPAELGQLLNLQELDLSSNQLWGSIPPELGNLTTLQTLNLSSNGLVGGIPQEFRTLASLQTLNLSSNQLSGSIPPQLGNLTALTSLGLQFNQLRGCLPQSLTNLLALQQFHFDTDRLWMPDNAAFAAWLAGIPDTSTGATTCKTYYFPVGHWSARGR